MVDLFNELHQSQHGPWEDALEVGSLGGVHATWQPEAHDEFKEIKVTAVENPDDKQLQDLLNGVCPSGCDEKRSAGKCSRDFCHCQCVACRKDCGEP